MPRPNSSGGPRQASLDNIGPSKIGHSPKRKGGEGVQRGSKRGQNQLLGRETIIFGPERGIGGYPPPPPRGGYMTQRKHQTRQRSGNGVGGKRVKKTPPGGGGGVPPPVYIIVSQIFTCKSECFLGTPFWNPIASSLTCSKQSILEPFWTPFLSIWTPKSGRF
jgi:hypothetical protein